MNYGEMLKKTNTAKDDFIFFLLKETRKASQIREWTGESYAAVLGYKCRGGEGGREGGGQQQLRK